MSCSALLPVLNSALNYFNNTKKLYLLLISSLLLILFLVVCTDCSYATVDSFAIVGTMYTVQLISIDFNSCFCQCSLLFRQTLISFLFNIIFEQLEYIIYDSLFIK